jgi:hypothetical protein
MWRVWVAWSVWSLSACDYYTARCEDVDPIVWTHPELVGGIDVTGDHIAVVRSDTIEVLDLDGNVIARRDDAFPSPIPGALPNALGIDRDGRVAYPRWNQQSSTTVLARLDAQTLTDDWVIPVPDIRDFLVGDDGSIALVRGTTVSVVEASGALRWSVDAPGTEPDLAQIDDRGDVYLVAGSHLHVLDATTGDATLLSDSPTTTTLSGGNVAYTVHRDDNGLLQVSSFEHRARRWEISVDAAWGMLALPDGELLVSMTYFHEVVRFGRDGEIAEATVPCREWDFGRTLTNVTSIATSRGYVTVGPVGELRMRPYP